MKNRFWLYAIEHNLNIFLFLEDLKKGHIEPYFVSPNGEFNSMKIRLGVATDGGYKSKKPINLNLPISKIDEHDVCLISDEQLENIVTTYSSSFKIFQTEQEYFSSKKASANLALIEYLQPDVR